MNKVEVKIEGTCFWLNIEKLGVNVWKNAMKIKKNEWEKARMLVKLQSQVNVFES